MEKDGYLLGTSGVLWEKVGPMFLTGTHERTLDEKHRVAIPKLLREGLETADGLQVYLAPSTDGAIAIYPESTFRQLGERLQKASPNARQVREYARLFFARATAARIDKQGRLRLPGELVELARLPSEVVLVGVQDHVEVWPREAWQNYVAERYDRYDDIAESAFELPTHDQ